MQLIGSGWQELIGSELYEFTDWGGLLVGVVGKLCHYWGIGCVGETVPALELGRESV